MLSKATDLRKFCDRCLKTRRWGGSVPLMIVDAAFDSIGLNYFNSVVPKVMDFEKAFVETSEVQELNDLKDLPYERVKVIWANKRSWKVANSVASHLVGLKERKNMDDRYALRKWAKVASFPEWREDPIGKIKGLGLTTYQYLRMMGGVDTAMPDKIVRRVIEEVLKNAGEEMSTKRDVELVETIHQIASMSDYRPIEICWMTWLVQYEGNRIRMEKYRDILERI